jgi:monooxygenase
VTGTASTFLSSASVMVTCTGTWLRLAGSRVLTGRMVTGMVAADVPWPPGAWPWAPPPLWGCAAVTGPTAVTVPGTVMVPSGSVISTLSPGRTVGPPGVRFTDIIETFTETGIEVSSGEKIGADIIVTAAGFNMSLFGDIAFIVDGEPVDFTERVTWRGVMISGVPNVAYVYGHLRYSWTLRAEMVCDLVADLLRHMEDKHATMVIPSLRPKDAGMERRPFFDPENFSSGYIMRSQDILFKQGGQEPWTHMLEYHQEREILPNADLDDGSLVYS